MRIDPAVFLALTAAMSACHRSEVPATGAAPGMPPATTGPAATAFAAPLAAPPVASASASSTVSPDPGADEALQRALGGYEDRLRASQQCVVQRFGPEVRGAEGVPFVLDALARQCGPMEYTQVPTSCSEGAYGCSTVVNTLRFDAAQRVLACLKAKRGSAICAPGVVRECTLKAITPVRPREDVAPVCQAIVDACGKASKALPLAECERYLSSMRKCHGVERAVTCLPEKCDVSACLDDWISIWSY